MREVTLSKLAMLNPSFLTPEDIDQSPKALSSGRIAATLALSVAVLTIVGNGFLKHTLTQL